MKKKLIAALLSAAMVVSVVPVFASDAAADEETATESSTESPLAGKKIAYITVSYTHLTLPTNREV